MRGTEMKGIEMKGIERLRDWVGTLRLSGLVWAEEMADELESTVDLIKREHAEDCCKMGLDYGSVSRVASEMERHVSGVEGMEDSPVARWARELREALTSNEGEKVKCCPADDVSMSSYDLLPQEDREAIAWVRGAGGLDAVKGRIDAALYYEAIAKVLLSRLGALNAADEPAAAREAMDRLEDRAMPEGMEWPRDESGEKALVGSEIADGIGHAHTVTSIEFSDGEVALHWNPGEPEECVRLDSGERVRRPEGRCRDCAHWQKDPTADNMGVCWFYYHEHEGQDCYTARRGDCGACDEFMPRVRALSERDAK